MKTNYTTLDSGRINSELYARLVKVTPGTLSHMEEGNSNDYVVATYKDTGNPAHGPVFYVSQMSSVEHFFDEQAATQYFLALMDPEEFGDPKELLKVHDPSRSYRWSPSVDVAKAVEAEGFRREVAR